MAAMTLSYCSFSCWSSASRVRERCWAIEKLPRMAQATATVSEMARISRAAIDRILNMGNPELREANIPEISQKMFNNKADHGRVVLRGAHGPDAVTRLSRPHRVVGGVPRLAESIA